MSLHPKIALANQMPQENILLIKLTSYSYKHAEHPDVIAEVEALKVRYYQSGDKYLVLISQYRYVNNNPTPGQYIVVPDDQFERFKLELWDDEFDEFNVDEVPEDTEVAIVETIYHTYELPTIEAFNKFIIAFKIDLNAPMIKEYEI
jgi:hypothetical protein